MAIRIREDDQKPTPVGLGILELQELIYAAMERDAQFRLDPYHGEGYRYSVDTSDHTLLVRSNDIGDVARFLGLAKTFAEPGVIPANAKPTRYVVNGVNRFGSIALQLPTPAPFGPEEQLRGTNGELDTKSTAFRILRAALGMKSGYGLLDCDKALRMKDGNATDALSLLVSTNGFAQFKV